MRSDRVDLWSCDEVHFQQYGSACRMWVPPENRNPVLYHHPTRKSVGYFGAVRLRDGKFVFQREEDRFNTRSFGRFLRYLKKRAKRCGRKIILLLDNASYHRAQTGDVWLLEDRAQFDLFFLPPYSPELNPIERVWKLTRRLCLHNRYFPTLEELTNRVEHQFFCWLCANATLRRLCAII